MKIKKKKVEEKTEKTIEVVKKTKEEKPVVVKNENPVFCVVSSRDRISDIAKKFDTTEEKIIELNGTKDIIGGNIIRVK